MNAMSLDALLTRIEKRSPSPALPERRELPRHSEKQQGQMNNGDSLPVDFINPGKLPIGCVLRYQQTCDCLLLLPKVGHGCLLYHETGPWEEEWLRLDLQKICPKKAQSANREKAA